MKPEPFKTPITKEENEQLKSKISIHVGKKIKEIRKNKGLTQQELSEKAGLHLTYVGHLETGTYHPSVFVLWKIANVLDALLDDFVK